jgi:hypothetical protein
MATMTSVVRPPRSYAQVLDALYPGRAHLGRLNFNAKRYDEKLSNMRLFEAALASCSLRRALPIEVCRVPRAGRTVVAVALPLTLPRAGVVMPCRRALESSARLAIVR